MNEASPVKPDKFRAYRARKKAQGLREIRMWVLDVNAPGFQDEIDRACRAINASEDSQALQRELNELAEDAWNDLP